MNTEQEQWEWQVLLQALQTILQQFILIPPV
jgi:hypothetical protein